MSNENRNNNVVIDLSNYTMDRTTLTSRNELIHLEQLDEVCRIIEDKIDYAKDYNPTRPYGFISQNDVISVFARRGAGKTTFVKSLVHLIRTSSEENFQELRKNLCCVDVFEPNQMLNKENLLIRFLAQISEEFHEKEEEKCCYQNCKDDYVRLKDARRKLYEAIPVIDGVGKGNLFPDWDDNVYVADRCMNLASNVKDLEKRFHHYIYTGLNIIGKKAILFVLDDSDVNIEKSFEILEIIRLFFTSPQIIVVLTGDASLYSMVVRRNYWKHFDMDFLKKDCDTLDKSCTKFREYRKMVYRLEAQYLQKMIKANHRIFLNNICDKIYLNKLKVDPTKIIIRLQTAKGIEEKEIYILYQDIFDTLALNKKMKSIQDTYINHFLTQPFRNQLRLFTAYADFLRQDTDNLEILTKGLLKVFEVYINQYSGDVKYLMSHSVIYSAWLLKFLTENHILNIGSSFLPVMESDSLKNAISVLGLSCYEQIKHNPSIIFDFWIRISMTKQLSVLWGESILSDVNTNLLSHAKLYSDNGLDQILGNMLTYGKNRPTNDGSIQTTIPGTIVRKGIFCNPDSDTYSYMEVKLINLLQIESVSSRQKTSFIYSLYRPLAVLGELLRTISVDEDFNTFDNLFEQLSQVKLYAEPNASIPIKERFKSEKINIDNFVKDLKDGSEVRNNEFLSKLHEWSKPKNNLKVAPFFLDRIFSRYFDLMISYSNQLKDDEFTLGNYINDAVLAFWNAAIVEKLLLVNEKFYTLQDHENSIQNLFFKNYIQIYKATLLNEKYSLFVLWLLDCPLFKAYIDPFFQELMRMIRDEHYDDYSRVWSLIRKHRSIHKNELCQKLILQYESDIKEKELQILDYDRYEILNNQIKDIDYSIKLYDLQLNLATSTLRQKKGYQKQIFKLTEEQRLLKKEFFRLGIVLNINNQEEDLGKLYKEQQILKNRIEHLKKEMNNYPPIEDNLYNIIEKKTTEIFSVCHILNNL